MRYQNLTHSQNLKVADLLIGAGKTIFVASVIVFLFPATGMNRPVLYSLLGGLLSGVLVYFGVILSKDQPENARRWKRR